MKTTPHKNIGKSYTPYEVWVATSDDPYTRQYTFLSAHRKRAKAEQIVWVYLCGRYGVAQFADMEIDGQFFHPNSPARNAPGSPGVDAYISDIRMSNARR
jgi:hypothetical protein